MKLQIAPERRIAEMFTLWPKAGAEVDLAIDPRDPYGLKFREGFVEVIYDFGLLSLTEPKKVVPTLKQWISTLKPGGELYLIEPDLEYLSRAIVGGDLKVEEFNDQFIATNYFSPESLSSALAAAGYEAGLQKEWYNPTLFTLHHFEKCFSITKK